ncbi:MAG: sialate O-acetylesterase [Gammaproteobacteria bacterium]|nr:sialate O-acetylesterase [Gammaproteobacteria bacterium]
MSYHQSLTHFVAPLLALAVLVGCGGGDTRSSTTGSSDGNSDASTASSATDGGQSDNFGLQLSTNAISVQEGDGSATVNISVPKFNGYAGNVALSAVGASASDQQRLITNFSDSVLGASENNATLSVAVDFSPHPILPQTRTLQIIGRDENDNTVTAEIDLNVTPTSRPDVYLLAGQSNMVGFSEAGAKAANPGEPDAPNSRILQLNVTGNDSQNFPTAASFSDPAAVAVPNPRFVVALDPLHSGYDVTIEGKEGTFIGLGLSFAKRALPDTTANIILVPTAWSNTGFCERENNEINNLGWLPAPVSNAALSGTLLHDRAIARTDIVIQETGGILRGILWHQGEADSDDLDCAVNYEQNLQNMVASLRSNIQLDARGAVARGSNADVPLVVGTMSRGGGFGEFPPEKSLVDNVHKNIASLVPFSTVVINDDLVPDAYPCGEGSCIHFGSRAYREMGVRYYDQLSDLIRP